MPPWIVYGLVIIFFLVLPLVIFFFVVGEPTSAKLAQSFVQNSDYSKQTAVISYGILAAIFAFIFVLTVFSQKSQKAATP